MEMSQHLKQTFEATIKVGLFPRSQIDIFVEVLQVLKSVISYENLNLCMEADGGNYCACVNAATLALIDAGIPLVDYVSACTASLVSEHFICQNLCGDDTISYYVIPSKKNFYKMRADIV